MALPGDYEAIFDEQIKLLNERGTPQGTINALSSKRRQVILAASGAKLLPERIPFLPIIPQSKMSINSQMQLIRYEQALGYSLLDEKLIHNINGVPNEPYYIFDIEDGAIFTDMSPYAAAALIRASRREWLTATEAIALCAHTDVLLHHFVDAAGSRYDNIRKNVNIFLEGKTPRMNYGFISDSNPDWGTASCRFRMK